MENVHRTLMMKPSDKVAVALSKIEKNTIVQVISQTKKYVIELQDDIQFGHKFAVVPIKKGEDILKYGEVIGVASEDIAEGEHVHIHNLEGKRGRGDKNDRAKQTTTGI